MEFRISNDNISSLSPRYTTTYAIKKGYFNLIRYLLHLGADPNYVNDKENFRRTSLMYTTFIKDDKWAENIAHNLLENGADLTLKDSKGLNPIHYSCAFGRDNLLEIFLNSIDFDLSRCVDKNGNNCMHYAIRSHNLKCVNLIIRKYKSSNFSKRIDLKNLFGLRPQDIEDDQSESFNLLKSSLFNGKDSLENCKIPLNEYIKHCNQLKMAQIQAKILSEMKSAEQKTKKKKSTKKTKKKTECASNSVSIEKPKISEFIEPITTSLIFKTQLEESQFIFTQPSLIENPKKPPRLLCNSNFNHFTGKIKTRPVKIATNVPKIVIHPPESYKNSIENSYNDFKHTTFTSSVVMHESNINDLRPESPESPEPPDPIKATFLTEKSFLIIFKDFILNMIEYNDLFYAKEHMIQSGLVNKITRIKSAQISQPQQEKEKIQPKTWKESLPNLFKIFESELTTSFRPTIRPPVTKKVKNNQKYYEELKLKSKQVAVTRKKKSKIVIVRNSLFKRLSNGSEITVSPETLVEDSSSVFEDEISILPANSRNTSSTTSIKRKSS